MQVHLLEQIGQANKCLFLRYGANKRSVNAVNTIRARKAFLLKHFTSRTFIWGENQKDEP